jgi:hypothetical protein
MLRHFALKSLFWLVFFVFWALPVLAQVDTAWIRRYNGPGNSSDKAWAIAVDGSGNIYVTGQSTGIETGCDYATIKYYPDGDTAWVRRYHGQGNDYIDYDAAGSIAVDSSGNVCVTGYSFNSGTNYDFATIKYYPDGDTAWVRRYNGPENGEDGGFAITVDGSGNAYVTGRSCSSVAHNDYTTIKYYPNGDTAWLRKYNGPENTDDWGRDIAVDDFGNVYVTGVKWTSGGWSSDYATIKYYPNGDTFWVRTYNGPGDSYDLAFVIALDGFGNVYVTGTSWGSGTVLDFATIKYYPNGDTAWVRRYDGPGNGDDYGRAMVIDDSNNVYVTGDSQGEVGHYDFATIKYYPNGDTAWVRRYNGPGDTDDGGFAIAVDNFGNVYVTGWSWSGDTTYSDYPTIKYYPNGDTAWVRRYNGPANSYDDANAIAVDGSGNVYVTGQSAQLRVEPYNYDYVTIKYYQVSDPPDPFSLLFPPKKASTPRVVRFDWETATDPNPFDQVRYDLHVSTSYQFPSHPDSTTIDSNLAVSEHIKTLDYGTYYWKVKAKDNWGAERWSDQIRYFMVTGIHAGDFNKDESIDVGDVVFLINYLYTSGPAPDPLELGDVNCDEGVNIGDVIFLINYLFQNGPPPSC